MLSNACDIRESAWQVCSSDAVSFREVKGEMWTIPMSDGQRLFVKKDARRLTQSARRELRAEFMDDETRRMWLNRHEENWRMKPTRANRCLAFPPDAEILATGVPFVVPHLMLIFSHMPCPLIRIHIFECEQRFHHAYILSALQYSSSLSNPIDLIALCHPLPIYRGITQQRYDLRPCLVSTASSP